jgi:hypothetical protein
MMSLTTAILRVILFTEFKLSNRTNPLVIDDWTLVKTVHL